MWAIFYEKKMIGKNHLTEHQAFVEASEKNLMLSDRYGTHLVPGCEIRRILG